MKREGEVMRLKKGNETGVNSTERTGKVKRNNGSDDEVWLNEAESKG